MARGRQECVDRNRRARTSVLNSHSGILERQGVEKMPLTHQPFSLKRATMVTIARNFDLICYSCSSPDKMTELIESEEYLNFECPFDDLPPHLVEELGEEVKHITYLRRHHLHALLSSKTVSWSSYGVGDLLVALNLLPSRCKNLRMLNISYMRHINPNALLRLVPNFTSLVSVNLRMTLTVDQMLAEIGENCPNLMDLNLTATPITDRGIVMLCMGGNGEPRCQKLTRLIVTDTWVTSSGAAIALLALPQLREFDFDRMFEVIDILHGWSDDKGERVLAALGVSSSRRPLAPRESIVLTTVTSSGETPGASAATIVANFCPFITSLTVTGTPLDSEALYSFMVLHHLTSLSLTNNRSSCVDSRPSMDFEEGVLPLITVIGHQLKNLILSKFTSVDITAIGKACPHLINFALSEISDLGQMHQKPSEPYFENLQALEIWSDPRMDINGNILQQLLLFAPNMKNLLFKGVGILNDKLLLETWKVNPMKQLSHLTLDHCHCLTNASLQWILDSDNKLTVLRIWSCCRITKEVKNHISNRILNENMDVYFEWFQLDD